MGPNCSIRTTAVERVRYYSSQIFGHHCCESCILLVVCLTDIVDTVMKEDDLDDDGYLTYIEYVLARRRAEAKHKNMKREDAKEDVKAADSG